MAVERPAFLVGSERSGTTLLRLMLDHHPSIAFNLESEYFVSRIGDTGAFPDARRFCEWLETDRVFRHSRFRINQDLGFTELLDDFLEQKRTRDGKRLVGATVHLHFSRLHRIWPKAKYIYLYRDGRDVANSVMRMGWAGNSYVAADWWLNAEREWCALRSALDPANWIEVRYEKLVADTVCELERICAFLGVGYSEKMFDYVRTSTYSAPDPTLNSQWKKGMRPLDLQRLEAKLGDALARRGYELSGLPRIQVSAIARRFLRLHSRLGGFLHRIRRFGLALTLLETVSRRFGLTRLHRRAIAKIDDIVDANLK